MAINDRDFSGFDEARLATQMKLMYRLLCHLETEIDAVKKAVITKPPFGP